MRWIVILFLILATGSLTKAIGINNYLQVITDIRKYYTTSCVIFVQSGNYQDLKITTLMHAWSREFSRRRVMTVTITFLELVSQFNEYRKIVRPLFVILLDTQEIMNEFMSATKSLNPISFPVWFVIFFQQPGNPLEEYCRHPTDNVFNVDFNTIMLVLCYDYPVLSEWYAVRDNRTRTFELATWTPDNGLILRTDKTLFSRRSDMFGDIMRVGSVEESPFILLENGTLAGFLGFLLLELSKTMNFKIKILNPVPAYGSWNVEEQRWTGVIGQLVTDNADIGVSEFTMTTHRLDVIDFTVPLIHSRTRIYFKEPDGSNVQWNGYFQAFSSGIWAMIVMIIVVAPVLLAVMKPRRPFSTRLILESYIDVWGIYCQQGLSEFPNESSMRLAFLSIFISALIISSAYSASLISFLTLTTVSMPFSTLEGYVEDGSYKLIVIKNSADFDVFNHAQDPVLKKVNESMKEKIYLPLVAPDGFKQVCEEKVAFYLSEVVKNAVNLYLPCKVVFIESGRAESMALALRKGSPYARAVNYHLRRFMDNGVLNRLKDNYLLTNLVPSETTHTTVGLWGIAPILAVLAGGMILGIMILITEKVYYVSNTKFKSCKSFIKKSNGNLGMKLQLQKRNKVRNLKLQGFYNTQYVRPIGYWP